MKLDHLVRLISQPWAIQIDVIENWCQILDLKLAGKEIPPEFAAASPGRGANGSDEPFLRDGNLAIVPVVGTLVKSNTLFSCDATYGQLKSALAAAEKAKGIDAIMLDGDTAGGTVAGANETADYIAKLNRRMPVYGWVDDLAASAGYWLLSQSRMIGAHAAADVGSIGVVAVHYDRSGRDAQNGVKRSVLAVGDLKAAGNDAGPLSAEERNYLMERMNQTYALFRGAVTRGRPGLADDAIVAMQSRVYKSAQAKEQGLVDHVMGRDEYIDHIKRHMRGQVSAAVPAKGARTMSSLTLDALRADHADLVAQIESAARAGMVAQSDHESAVATARSEAAASAQQNLLALHAALYGEAAGAKFAAIVDSGVTATQAQALGVSAQAEDGHAAILKALHAAAPEGLKPGQVVTPAKAGIDTAGIYAARQANQ